MASGNKTGATEPLGELTAADVNLELDVAPVASQPGSLRLSGLAAAAEAADMSLVVPATSSGKSLVLSYRGGLTGPATVPVSGETDGMTIPIQYPAKPGQVGVQGTLIYRTQDSVPDAK